jgi:hypothetical protein
MASPKNKRSELFSLRLWSEETADGHTEWRGKVERVVSGETLYFRDWDSMLEFLRGNHSAPLATEHQQHPAGQLDGQT